MRSSDWQITWDPAGASPLVLLDYDDLMDAEIRLPREQLSAVGKSDFSLRITPLARQNMKARLEFSRRLSHDTAAASWDASLTGLTTLPWGKKAPLRVQPRGGTARDYTAAVLSSSHRPSYQDGIIESIHSYALRVVILPFPARATVGVTGALFHAGDPVTFPPLLRAYNYVGGRVNYSLGLLGLYWDAASACWILTGESGPYQPQWRSYDDVATPELCTTWEATGSASGTPVINLL